MTVQATETAIVLPGPDVPVDEAQLAIVAFLALQRPHPRGVSARPAHVLPMGARQRPRRACRHPGPRRALPLLDGGAGPGRLDDRPASLDGLRLLPVRSHRRAHRLQPCSVRPAPEGPTERGPWHGPG